MAAPRWVQDLLSSLFRRDYSTKDLVMVALAVVSIVAVSLAGEPLFPDAARPYLLWIDRVIVGVFILEYAYDLAVTKRRRAFVKGTWYDLVGLIPFPFTVLRVFRLLRIPHVFIWGSRYPDGGEPYVVRVVRDYQPVIVEEITDPVLLKLLKVLRGALGRGRYASTMGAALDERRDRFHAVVVHGLRRNRALRAALLVPGADELVRETENQVFDVLVATLTDPELDAIMRESIDAPLEDLERRLREKREGARPAVPDASEEPEAKSVPVTGPP